MKQVFGTGPHVGHALLGCSPQPVSVTVWWQDHHHPLFIYGLVKLSHQQVLICIDGQHGVAEDRLTLGGLPRRPQPRNAHGLTVGEFNPSRNGLATAPVGLVNGIGWNDAVLPTLPRLPETRLCSHRLAPGVVGATGDPGVFGPVRHQTKQAIQGLMFRHGIVTHIGMGVSANETAQIPRPEVKLAEAPAGGSTPK
jgi:hypothetical protein